MNKNYMEANPHTDPDNISTNAPDDTTATPETTEASAEEESEESIRVPQ